MTDSSRPRKGKMQWVPEGAFVVFLTDDVVGMFGHNHPGSTRKLMSRFNLPAVTGWTVEDVKWALGNARNPELVEKRRNRKTALEKED